jgi:flagellar biosynthesis/type III secretory pathway protein FliH
MSGYRRIERKHTLLKASALFLSFRGIFPRIGYNFRATEALAPSPVSLWGQASRPEKLPTLRTRKNKMSKFEKWFKLDSGISKELKELAERVWNAAYRKGIEKGYEKGKEEGYRKGIEEGTEKGY